MPAVAVDLDAEIGGRKTATDLEDDASGRGLDRVLRIGVNGGEAVPPNDASLATRVLDHCRRTGDVVTAASCALGGGEPPIQCSSHESGTGFLDILLLEALPGILALLLLEGASAPALLTTSCSICSTVQARSRRANQGLMSS